MLYTVLRFLVVRPVMRFVYRAWVEGLEHVPTDGPAIIVANHVSAGDTLLIPAMLPRRLTFPAKIELFQGTGPRGRLLGWFLRAVGQRPMDRSGGRASATGIGSVGDVLDDGHLLAIFPEGTRSPDGRLYKGKTGAARLVLAGGAPVIPVAVVGTRFVPSRRLKIPTMRRPGVVVGRPMDFSAFAEAGNHRDTLRWVTDEIMNAIMELSGQTYVDVYGSSVKEARAEGRTIEEPTPPRPGYGRTRPLAPSSPAPLSSAPSSPVPQSSAPLSSASVPSAASSRE